jgi:hypothetical protein
VLRHDFSVEPIEAIESNADGASDSDAGSRGVTVSDGILTSDPNVVRQMAAIARVVRVDRGRGGVSRPLTPRIESRGVEASGQRDRSDGERA